jgi:predicted 2-oxoglutarate/Fe(II)-dependent dioxygenase YbiX
MKSISGIYIYDDEFFLERLPPETHYLPDPSHEYPIFMEESFFSHSDCTALVDKLFTSGPFADASTEIGVRKSKQYILPQEDKKQYDQAFLRTKPKIEAFFSATIKSSEVAHGLGYKVGDRYAKHSDNCEPVLDANGSILRFKYSMPHRQISTVLFLTDSVMDITGAYQCIGGNLSFPFIRDQHNEMLIVEPRIGLFVAFPSNPIFTHEVHEVFEGFRMTIVDWHSAVFHKPGITQSV